MSTAPDLSWLTAPDLSWLTAGSSKIRTELISKFSSNLFFCQTLFYTVFSFLFKSRYFEFLSETEDLCFPSSSSKTISKNEETSCEENLSRALSDWEATVGDTQSRIGLKINNDGLSSMNEGYLDFRAKGIKRPSRGTIISQYLSTPS